LEHQQIPPTAGFGMPGERLAGDQTPFEVLPSARPWTAVPGRPRRAAINGFGFGGINAHLLFEEFDQGSFTPATQRLSSTPGPQRVESTIAVVGLAAHVGPWSDIDALRPVLLGLRPVGDG